MLHAYARLDAAVLSVGNDYLERCFSLGKHQACITTSFVNKLSGRDYARPGSHEFSFASNGLPLTARDFTVAKVEISGDDPAEAAIHLQSAYGLSVAMHFQVYAQYPLVRKWLCISNIGSDTLTLAELNWEDLNLLVDTSASAEVWEDYFTRRVKAVVSSMDDCALLVNDTLHHEGFIVASEAPGPLKRMEVYAQAARVCVGYNRDDETIFEWLLAPGESFTTPAGFILTFATPIPQDAVDSDFARFVADRLTVCAPAQVPSVTVNTWQPFETRIDSPLLREQIGLAAELGVDAYQVDDGWYDRLGDWHDDRAKFPNGLVEIAELARAHGMRFGLWMAVATVAADSEVCRAHPDWLARDRHGEPNRHPIPGALTMCLDSGYYDFVLDKIDGVIERYGVELLKLDLSAVRNLYAPDRYPGCFAAGHAHRGQRASHARITLRLFALIRELKRRHPRCLIDLSYELYGVMDGTDLALTQVADQNWFTNIASPNEINLRREIYQRGRVTRPWTLNFGGATLDHPNAPHYGLFSTLTSHALFWGDLAKLDTEQRAHYCKWFAWIKAQRARSDFYRYYQVSDIFPVPDGASSRDFRHAIPAARYGIAPRGIHPPAFEPASTQLGEFWDGVARLDPSGEGPIFLFRPAASRVAQFQLRVPWVPRTGRFTVTDLTGDRELGIFEGAELHEHGVSVTIDEPLNARVIVVRPVPR